LKIVERHDRRGKKKMPNDLYAPQADHSILDLNRHVVAAPDVAGALKQASRDAALRQDSLKTLP